MPLHRACFSGFGFKTKNPLIIERSIIKYSAQLYGGDKRDRTADLCGAYAAQPPKADLIKMQEVSVRYPALKQKSLCHMT